MLWAVDAKTNFYGYGRIPSLLTFQHEVALRMVAPPEDYQRCRLSVMAQNYMEIDYMFKLPGGAFVPAPDVEVGVVKIVPHREKYIDGLPFHVVNKVVTGMFLSKQSRFIKPIKLNLFPKSVRKEAAAMLLDLVDIPEDKVPIQLTMDEIARICYAYDKVCQVMEERGVGSSIPRSMGPDLLALHVKEKREKSRIEKMELESKGSRFFEINFEWRLSPFLPYSIRIKRKIFLKKISFRVFWKAEIHPRLSFHPQIWQHSFLIRP